MLPTNPLDALFRDIQKDLREAGRKPPPKLVPLRQSTYANPLNWRPGKSVQIIHATEGAVGVFREYFHKMSPSARRLLPAPPGTAVDCNELVFGDWWLHPRNSAPLAPDTTAEVRALTARFNELVDLFLE
jgi:hypothetical protein